MVRIIGLLVFIALVTGCESVGSDHIKTSGVYARLLAQDTKDTSGNDVQVKVELLVGGASSNTYLDTKNTGDTVNISRNGVSRTAIRNKGILGDVYYTYSFGSATGEDVFTVDFSRLDGVSAPSSTVTMPQVFSIANSATTFDISDNNTINFIYTPTDFSSFGSVSYRIDGDCINTFSGNLNIASGSLSISANNLGSLIAGPNEVVPSACAITASFTHTNSGSIDAAFGGGKFTANRDVDIAMTIQE